MTDLVDQMFPPVNREITAEFTDFNYWRTPVVEFELPYLDPPSPTLSARSDTSRLSRIRNFSLGRPTSAQGQADKAKQQVAAALGKGRPSSPLASPALTANDPDEYWDEPQGPAGHRRDRRLSMPGSLEDRYLDDPNFGEEDSGTFEHHQEDGSEDGATSDEEEGQREEDEQAAFEDDLLATGEMNDIPF